MMPGPQPVISQRGLTYLQRHCCKEPVYRFKYRVLCRVGQLVPAPTICGYQWTHHIDPITYGAVFVRLKESRCRLAYRHLLARSCQRPHPRWPTHANCEAYSWSAHSEHWTLYIGCVSSGRVRIFIAAEQELVSAVHRRGIPEVQLGGWQLRLDSLSGNYEMTRDTAPLPKLRPGYRHFRLRRVE